MASPFDMPKTRPLTHEVTRGFPKGGDRPTTYNPKPRKRTRRNFVKAV